MPGVSRAFHVLSSSRNDANTPTGLAFARAVPHPRQCRDTRKAHTLLCAAACSAAPLLRRAVDADTHLLGAASAQVKVARLARIARLARLEAAAAPRAVAAQTRLAAVDPAGSAACAAWPRRAWGRLRRRRVRRCSRLIVELGCSCSSRCGLRLWPRTAWAPSLAEDRVATDSRGRGHRLSWACGRCERRRCLGRRGGLTCRRALRGCHCLWRGHWDNGLLFLLEFLLIRRLVRTGRPDDSPTVGGGRASDTTDR